GIGVLYRARQLRLDRPVALKLVEPDVARDPMTRERLRREARTVAALDHPNVVPLYEAGEQDGNVYIVTRWVEGTEPGTLMQIEGNEPDARGDVYGLGCVLFEMLVGEPPFAEQKGGMAKMWAHVNAESPAVRERRPEVPPGLEEVIGRAMAKAPDARPTAAAFRTAVLRAVGEPA